MSASHFWSWTNGSRRSRYSRRRASLVFARSSSISPLVRSTRKCPAHRGRAPSASACQFSRAAGTYPQKIDDASARRVSQSRKSGVSRLLSKRRLLCILGDTGEWGCKDPSVSLWIYRPIDPFPVRLVRRFPDDRCPRGKRSVIVGVDVIHQTVHLAVNDRPDRADLPGLIRATRRQA